MKAQNTTYVRASISFPAEMYQSLDALAKEKKVSLAWVVRDASEKYLAVERGSIQARRKKTNNA